MVKICLSRFGKKKQPTYRVIVVDKRRDPWGGYLENLGTYNPLTKPKTVALKEDRVRFWLERGAAPSTTVWNLLVDAKIITKAKQKVHIKKKAQAPAPAGTPQAPTAS